MVSKLNAEWHRTHRMPTRPTLEQRLEWHLEHQKHCGCREMPASIRAELARRGGSGASGSKDRTADPRAATHEPL